MNLMEATKNKTKNILLVYFMIFVPMWGLFIINNLIFRETLSSLGGIHPRSTNFMDFIDIFTSWMFHSSKGIHIYDHILGNSIALLGLLFIVSLIENRPFKLLMLLIFGSGVATWLLGSGHSIHIGASGLVFSLFGYVISSAIFARRWIYFIPIFILGGEYFYSIKAGLIPQNGISFAAHFGGLIAGLIIGYLFNLKAKKTEQFNSHYKKTLKQKIHDFIWNTKYAFKQKFR